jgi:uncharacterized protein YndB with AHSA1/START domain
MTITVSIQHPHRQVYEFLVEPLNLPTWTVAIERIEHRRDNDWAIETPEGVVVLRYQPRNEFGVLDYWVLPPGDPTGYFVPMRVIANGDGADVIFTHYQRPGQTEEQWTSEGEWIRADLETLKALLESRPRG